MPYRICLISLGCAKNQVNSEQMLYLLNQAGHEVVGEVDGCDVAIVNTCGFIDSAKSEAIDQILQLAEVKKAGGLKKILVTGCLSQRYEKDILESLPEVDGMLGTGSFGQICAAVEDVMHDGRPLYFGDKSGPIEEIGRVVTTGPGWAYLRIAEGCDNWCAFCAIPAIRGRYRSRTLDAIVQEARELADLGVKELIVIAQDITRWGMDLYGKPSLALLLRELAKIDGIRWIRLFYLYPHYFTDELMDLIVKEEKICPYVDLPLQHISQSVLQRMNRRDSEADVRSLMKKLCSHGRKLTLRSTFIVGFPGETEEEFQELCDFVKETEFDDVGVFTYSREDGTPAALMDGQIPEEVKEERYHQLMAIQAKVSEIRNQELEGSVHTMLVERVEEEKGIRQAVGRIEIQAPDVDGLTYLEDAQDVQPGDMIPVRIAQGFAYDLVAERMD